MLFEFRIKVIKKHQDLMILVLLWRVAVIEIMPKKP